MFMFIFAVVLIAIVGLFLQVMLGLGGLMAQQQMALGQQMLYWHSAAYEYACRNMGVNNATVTRGNVTNLRPAYSGPTWNSNIFNGNFGGTTVRLVITYLPSGTIMSGYPSSVVASQLQRIRSYQRDVYNFSLAQGGAVTITIATTPPTPNVTVTGLPAAVTNGSLVLISNAATAC